MVVVLAVQVLTDNLDMCLLAHLLRGLHSKTDMASVMETNKGKSTSKSMGPGTHKEPTKINLPFWLAGQASSTKAKFILTSQGLPSKQPFILWEIVPISLMKYFCPLRSLGDWPNDEYSNFLILPFCRHWWFTLLPSQSGIPFSVLRVLYTLSIPLLAVYFFFSVIYLCIVLLI